MNESRPLLGLVEELDGRRASVAGAQGQSHRGLAELTLLLGGEHRAARLLDHLLVSPLEAAVADTNRPGGPLSVGDHLHLDVACRLDQLLEQDGVVSERVSCLGAGAVERVLELLGAVDAADAAPAATRRRLDQQRIADRAPRARVHRRGCRRRRRSTAPPEGPPPRPGAWPRPCRRAAAWRSRSGRRRPPPGARRAPRSPDARPRSPSPPMRRLPASRRAPPRGRRSRGIRSSARRRLASARRAEAVAPRRPPGRTSPRARAPCTGRSG